MTKTQPRRAKPADGDLYVLFGSASAARYPFLAAWIVRHRLSAGFRVEHLQHYRHVLVIGAPDGLVLPATCRVAFVQAEEADRRFAADPHPSTLFEEEQ